MKAGHKALLAKLEADRQASMKAWREEMAAVREMMDASHKMGAEMEPERHKDDGRPRDGRRGV
jgi:hypothetical protein